MKIFSALLFLAGASFAYIPLESGFVSLENEHGIWGNAAGVSAFDSWGALTSYDYDDGIKQFKIGGNLENWAAGFDYKQGPKNLDEARWSLTHGSDFFNRAFFVGERVNAFRSSAFNGTEWSLDLGAMLRPFRFLSLGYSIDNLLYLGPNALPNRVQNLGATIRLGNFFSVSYDVENFENHRLLLELDSYSVRWGLRVPLHGDDEFRLSFSTSFGPYNNASLHIYDDYIPKGFAFGFHSSRSPKSSMFSKIIRVPLDMEISETEKGIPFFAKTSTSIWQVRNLFEHLNKDPSAGILLLDFSGYKGNTGISHEIDRYVLKYKSTGGMVIAYLDDIRPSVLLASAHADRIVVEPSAHLNWRGLGGNILFYKGLLDKLGVKVEFLRHGKYKSAVEPYIADSMSVEAKENLDTLYGDLWKLTEKYISMRKLVKKMGSENALNYLDSLAQKPLVTASAAKNAMLVDTLLYLDQVPAYALKTFFNLDAPYATYNTWRPTTKKIFSESWNHRTPIALLNIDGTIDNRMEKSVLESLRRLPYTGAQALIVRISSPGGSALASDKIWAALRHVSKMGIPVVSSIGYMGASGGYYIACGGDIIFAEPTSIVGSIGIYGGKVDASGLLAKVGLKAESVKTHNYADATTFTRPWTESEKAALQEYMDEFYERFTGVVSAATGIPQNQVDSLYGGGRVMTGIKALDAHLVHKIGGIDDAIFAAKKLAKISDNIDIELTPLNSGDAFLLPSTNAKILADYMVEFSNIKLWAIEPLLWGIE